MRWGRADTDREKEISGTQDVVELEMTRLGK